MPPHPSVLARVQTSAMDSYEQQNKPTESNRDSWALADSAPIIASGILAGGRIIAARISGEMVESEEGDGK